MANRYCKQTIYCIRNIINNKIYIGSSVDFKNRVRLHRYDLNHNKHHSIYLQRAWNKYGEGSFVFEIIRSVEIKEHLVEYEQIFIDFFKPEYNMSKIAGSALGTKRSEEQKKNMSKPRSEEGKRNIIEGVKKRKPFDTWNKGKSKVDMNIVMGMKLNGFSQKEIGEFFKTDQGTISRYIKKHKNKEVVCG